MEEETEKTRTANKWVWWIALLAGELSYQRREPLTPQIGDTVVETTHIMGLARHRLGFEDAVGELVAIEERERGGPIFTLKLESGKLQNWENARLVVIDRPAKAAIAA